MALHFRSADNDYSQVFVTLRDWLQADSPAPSGEIANKIDAYHAKSFEEEKQLPKEEKEGVELDPDGCYGPLWEIWIAFIVIVEQVPHNHAAQDKLVDVINGLKDLAGRKVELEGADLDVWKALPIFDSCVRDYYQPNLNTEKSVSPETAQKWRNVTSFVARCWQTGFFNASPQALYLLRATLEQPVKDTSALEQILPIASEWIIHSRAALHESVQSGHGPEEIQGQSAGTLYQGPNKLCNERWGFWKGRFEEVAGQLQGDIKELALHCASEMGSISN
ncbi:hypothetical protein N7509_002926 [Penicillium cosmopolitanum]|uniref:Uncharacterized protein n=1 Tax=Penicillium cosmopolitanum TaxID=1131564 RepID=A0A9W9WA61_9EURO|nr:uncharacterized protein N7509_002926 [Penicillium cosmopolitanum]KAJ5409043.1 hypothetical protein N7509_002926 [Penicillium cosmopolitanum]